MARLVTSAPLVGVATELRAEANELLRAIWSGRSGLEAVVTAVRALLPSARWPPDSGGKRHAVDAAAVGGGFQGPLSVLSAGRGATPLKYQLRGPAGAAPPAPQRR